MVRFAALALLAACYAPKPQAGSRCSASGACPAGLVCAPATATCEASVGPPADGPIDAPLAEGPPPDVAIDAPPLTTTLRQQVTNFNADNDTPSISASLASSPIAGDTLVFVGGSPGNVLDSVTGGGVAAWTRVARSNKHVNVEVWIGVTDGSTTIVTMTCAACGSPNTMWVGEFDNLASLDVQIAAGGLTSPIAFPGAITTTAARDLLIFAAADGMDATFGTPAPGAWTMGAKIVAPNTTQGVWWRSVDAIDSYTVSATEDSHQWDAALVALKRR